MSSHEFDVIVIGMGPGGEEVAERLAEAGLRVAGIEHELVGGECPYWGCIPSKMIVRAADALAEARRVPALAGNASVRSDWAPVARKIREQATDSWDDQAAADRFQKLGGRLFRGRGRLTGPASVSVGDDMLEASRGIVVATGSSPVIPPLPGLADASYWTNRDVIEAPLLPRSLVVLGGGAIGLELSQALARFGVDVTIVEAMERILSIEEPEAGDLLARVLADDGIDIRTGSRAASVRHERGELVLALEDGQEVHGERLLVATGRRANIRQLGLETAGLDPSARFIGVDDHLRAAPGLWAVGDVTGAGAFTHVAVYQARIVIAELLGQDGPGADYNALPRVTFTDPEVGAVGLTEAQAQQRGIRTRTGYAPLRSATRGFIHGPGAEGFFKLVEDADRGVLVGATAAGPSGGEMLSMFEVAIAAAVPTDRLRHLIYPFPTFHRGVEVALQALGAPVAAA